MKGIFLALLLLVLVSACTAGNFKYKEVEIRDIKIGEKCLACHGEHPKVLR